MRPRATSTALAAAFLSLAPAAAHATPYRLTRADRAEIERLLRGFFEATRDGNAAAAAASIPTREEFRTLFVAGAEPLIERHQRAIERDVRELRARFAGGSWVGLSGSFAAAPTLELGPCGRFGAARSQCTSGPVIDWRAGGTVQHLRIDALVRVNGRWKIFDPRL